MKIHYHSDCSFFAGCENMLANFFQSEHLLNLADISFSYRYSMEYAAGFKSRVPRQLRSTPLNLLSEQALSAGLDRRLPGVVVKVINVAKYLLFARYLIFIVNSVIMVKYFAKNKPDILHVNNGGFPGANSAAACIVAAKLCGVRHIIYVVNNMAIHR